MVLEKKIFSSPEPKAQVRFSVSDQNLSVEIDPVVLERNFLFLSLTSPSLAILLIFKLNVFCYLYHTARNVRVAEGIMF